jgi:hypothetical protein
MQLPDVNATVYDHLSAGHGLCRAHDWRHYLRGIDVDRAFSLEKPST